MSEDEISETADSTAIDSTPRASAPPASSHAGDGPVVDETARPDDLTAEIDLDAMAADLDGVDAALVRLADGTYWTDEVTGDAIPTEVLEANPMARRA